MDTFARSNPEIYRSEKTYDFDDCLSQMEGDLISD